jgi:CsoR family transcriptional regulator, copper-sensing transcriptional repressor
MPKQSKPKTKQSPSLTRLARIEGQLRGVRRMMEEGAECGEIITQISAIKEAVSMLGAEILKDEIVCRIDEKKDIDDTYLKNLIRMK